MADEAMPDPFENATFDELFAYSSLNSPGVRTIRDRIPPDQLDELMTRLHNQVRSAREDFIITFSIDAGLENTVVSSLHDCAVRFTLHDGTIKEGMVTTVGVDFFVYAPANPDLGGWKDELESLKFDDIKEVMYL